MDAFWHILTFINTCLFNSNLQRPESFLFLRLKLKNLEIFDIYLHFNSCQ